MLYNISQNFKLFYFELHGAFRKYSTESQFELHGAFRKYSTESQFELHGAFRKYSTESQRILTYAAWYLTDL